MYDRKDVDDLVELVTNGRKKWVRYNEGAALYSLGLHTFQKLAKEAGAVYHVGRVVLVNLDKFDEYMEIFCDDPHY